MRENVIYSIPIAMGPMVMSDSWAVGLGSFLLVLSVLHGLDQWLKYH